MVKVVKFHRVQMKFYKDHIPMLIKNLKETEVGHLQGGLACFRGPKTPLQETNQIGSPTLIFQKLKSQWICRDLNS